MRQADGLAGQSAPRKRAQALRHIAALAFVAVIGAAVWGGVLVMARRLLLGVSG